MTSFTDAKILLGDKNVETSKGCFQVDNLQTDSRLCNDKSVFIAIKGTQVNGLDFAPAAVERGARCVVVEESNLKDSVLDESLGVPVFVLDKNLSLGEFASSFYGEPSKKLKLIGITGTNGKSTITQLIASWLYAVTSSKVGVIGTLGYGYLKNLKKSANTTPDAVALQRILYEMVNDGAQYAVMEVSSIGIAEGRIDGCNFVAGGFTNLTRDHLDYHKSMENYALCKEQFLKCIPKGMVSINIDDTYGRNFAEVLESCVQVSLKRNLNPVGSSYDNKYVKVNKVIYKRHGIYLEVDSFKGSLKFEVNLLGRFNVENIVVALGVLLSLNIPVDRLEKTASVLKPVTGRMECFSKDGLPSIVVDYAHTPDGVEQVLRAVREHHKEGKVWCILGCGGNRDKGKRPIMAIKACVYADNVIFTSDNPRKEDPKQIINDMILGVTSAHNYISIVDRSEAISYAFKNAKPLDCIVIAGKGHEDYQIFADKTINFSDRKIAAKLLGVNCD